MKPTFEFVCSYYHDGAWWAVSIQAYDWEDAEARVRKLGNLRLDGQVVARVYVGGECINDKINAKLILDNE